MQHIAVAALSGVPNGEGWRQIGELGLALLLSSLIGFEREFRQKNAGLRTHSLVGLGAALFMLISKYGFTDVLEPGRVVLDPSRVAAQIVTGVGFLGAGIIFVRRDAVRGLTTAASIWVTAAVGACAGAGLPILAVVTTGAYLLIIAVAFSFLAQHLPRSSVAASVIRVRYPDGRGVLRTLIQVVTANGFKIEEVSTEPAAQGSSAEAASKDDPGPMVEVTMHLHGKGRVRDLVVELSELDHVHVVASNDANTTRDAM